MRKDLKGGCGAGTVVFSQGTVSLGVGPGTADGGTDFSSRDRRERMSREQESGVAGRIGTETGNRTH